MSSAECSYFAAEFKISANFVIVKYPETIDDRQPRSGPFNDGIGRQFEIRLVRHRQNDSPRAFDGRAKVMLNTDLCQTILIAEEP